MLKKLLVLMAVAALVAVAGACGSPEEGSSEQKNEPAGVEAGGAETEAKADTSAKAPTAIETVQVAYRETAAEQTAKTSFRMTMTGPEVDPENSGRPAPVMMSMTGGGAMDFSGKASVLSMQMAGMGTMEVRQVGDVVYAKMPEGSAMQVPGGKPWLKMDAEEVYGGSGQMQGGAVSDPTRQLEYLRGVSDSVEKVGSEKVRGVQTTRYEATIDMKKLVGEQGGEAREKYEDALRQTGMEKMPVEIWLDDQNRVRRYVMDMNMNAAQDASGAPRGGMRMRIVAEYYDFGTPVKAQAPPPNQTTDARKVMPAQQTPAA